MLRSDVGDAHRLSLSEALSISENRSSQGETTGESAYRAYGIRLLRPSPRLPDMGAAPVFRQPKRYLYPDKKYFYNRR